MLPYLFWVVLLISGVLIGRGEIGERTHARHLSAFLPLFHKPLHLIRGVRDPRGAVGKEE